MKYMEIEQLRASQIQTHGLQNTVSKGNQPQILAQAIAEGILSAFIRTKDERKTLRNNFKSSRSPKTKQVV